MVMIHTDERMFDEGDTIQIVLKVSELKEFVGKIESQYEQLGLEMQGYNDYVLPRINEALEIHEAGRVRCHQGDYPTGSLLYRCVKKEGHEDNHRYEEDGIEVTPWIGDRS